jgi:fermentation-respiration switch protein FrsA (DUF1100 family)
MFYFFPDNKFWSQAVLIALNSGGDISEIQAAAGGLVDGTRDPSEWADVWVGLGRKLTAQAAADEAAGHTVSAGNKYKRAAAYLLVAERVVQDVDPRKFEIYREALQAFGKYAAHAPTVIENVEIPYGDTSLPALFLPCGRPGANPTLVLIDGFDLTKELLAFRRIEEAHKRGLSVLIVDTPGIGGSLRLRGLTLRPDTEVPIGAVVDYLETRDDVDHDRIGLAGVSLGGYYAPRAAAFEKRLKGCIAWGAIWEAGPVFDTMYAGAASDLPAPSSQLTWVTGTSSINEGLAVMRTLTLDGVADKITCPLLVLQGADDHLVPMEHAEKTVKAAVNAPRADLVVLDTEDGGSQHCQFDNIGNGADIVFDWAADVLGATAR